RAVHPGCVGRPGVRGRRRPSRRPALARRAFLSVPPGRVVGGDPIGCTGALASPDEHVLHEGGVEMNVVALVGRLARPAEERVLPSGDRLVAYEVTVPREGERAETVPVVWFEAP